MVDEPAYIKALKAVTRGSISTTRELYDYEQELYGENDRAVGILFGSLVERSLEDFLKTKMRPDGLKPIFGYDGILGSFSHKINIAYSLSFIGPISRHDLHIIRMLRNEFAHSTRHFGFSTPEVKPVCDALQILDQNPDALHGIMHWSAKDKRTVMLTDKTEPKTRFMLTCHDFSYRFLYASGKLTESITPPWEGMPPYVPLP